MKELNPLEAAAVFAGSQTTIPQFTINPIGGGLINHSLKVSPATGNSFLLQCINDAVFKNPEQVQQNYRLIWDYCKNSGAPLRLPRPIQAGANLLYRDKNGYYWRAFEFISNAVSYSIAHRPALAAATAHSFASFTAAFVQFDANQLFEVIPDFHNLGWRFRQFNEAVTANRFQRLRTCAPLADQLLARKTYADFYETLIANPADYPLRVMHHDAKIANVLFDKATDTVICLVDFDTVMAGHFFSDLGDIIRSMACSHDENEPDSSLVVLRPEYYEAILSGYLSVMKDQFTAAELANLHQAGPLLIYMQALRFLADYLEGDSYYRVTYPEQNLRRAENQFALLKSLEHYLANTTISALPH